MKLRRIGFDAGLACSSKPTGVESYARCLLRALLDTIPEWAEAHVYLPSGAATDFWAGPRARVHLRPDMNMALKNPWLVARSWWDGLEVMYAFGHRLPAGCRGLHVPTLHDAVFEEYPECYAPGVALQLQQEVRRAVARATAMAVVSYATAKSLEEYYRFRGPVIVTGAAAKEHYKPTTEDGPDSSPYFLYVGRIDKRKNVVRLVQAYRQLVQSGHSCKLIIVGPNDSGAQELTETLESNRVAGEQIDRPGYLKDEELLQLYQHARAFVYPSFAEGFGMPLLEAMACGTPVISSNRSALLEVGEGAALLVAPENVTELAAAMETLLTSQQQRKHYRAAGFERVKLYSWKKSAQAVWEGLRQLLRA